ncbi:hypothetical protein VP01_2667g1 [Puccinia sorghi]|uniref:Uncharacterized protein n=1 Tax=Puccinia sorghi TaxID=27349 RepID=A0A0L6V5R9_9BASI|nr:hypothetical protein VP01_2667g1 [Puccinia sorghi]
MQHRTITLLICTKCKSNTSKKESQVPSDAHKHEYFWKFCLIVLGTFDLPPSVYLSLSCHSLIIMTPPLVISSGCYDLMIITVIFLLHFFSLLSLSNSFCILLLLQERNPKADHSKKKIAQLPAVDMQKVPGSFCCYKPSPKVIQPSFAAQSLCILHSNCAKNSTWQTWGLSKFFVQCRYRKKRVSLSPPMLFSQRIFISPFGRPNLSNILRKLSKGYWVLDLPIIYDTPCKFSFPMKCLLFQQNLKHEKQRRLELLGLNIWKTNTNIDILTIQCFTLFKCCISSSLFCLYIFIQLNSIHLLHIPSPCCQVCLVTLSLIFHLLLTIISLFIRLTFKSIRPYAFGFQHKWLGCFGKTIIVVIHMVPCLAGSNTFIPRRKNLCLEIHLTVVMIILTTLYEFYHYLKTSYINSLFSGAHYGSIISAVVFSKLLATKCGSGPSMYLHLGPHLCPMMLGGRFWGSVELFWSEYVDCKMRSHLHSPGGGILSSESGHPWHMFPGGLSTTGDCRPLTRS